MGGWVGGRRTVAVVNLEEGGDLGRVFTKASGEGIVEHGETVVRGDEPVVGRWVGGWVGGWVRCCIWIG